MRSTFRVVSILSVAVAVTVGAQVPGMPGSGGAPATKLLLANTGELALTDQQVVRLAAIARRSEARRSSLRAAMDSARGRLAQPGDTAARRQFAARMRADAIRAREQMLADQRDAIAILTPDQQAKAWNMVSQRGQGMREARGGRGPRQGAMRGGERMRGRPDMQRGPRRAPMAGERDRRSMPAPRPAPR